MRLQLLLLVSSAASAASAAASWVSPWPVAAAYALPAGDLAIRLCTRDALVHARGGALFALLPTASLAADAVASTSRQADALLRALSTPRAPVTNGSRVQVSGSGGDVDTLYRAELGSGGDDLEDAAVTNECVDALLPVTSAGTFLLFSEFATLETAIFDAELRAPVPMLQCVAGCASHASAVVSAAAVVTTAGAAGDELGASSDGGWVSPVVASLLISLTSIVGVVILSFDKGRVESIVEYMTSFGAGCLLGVVVFHLYPEGTGYLSDTGHWVMGACVLVGIVFSMSVEAGVHMMLAAFGVDHCNDGHSHGHHPHHDHTTMDQLSETDRLTLSPESQSPSGHSHASHHVALSVHEPVAKHSHSHSPGGSERDSLVKGDHSHEYGYDHSHGHSHNHGHSHSHGRSHSHHRQSFWRKHITPLVFVDPVAWITAVGDFFHAFTDGVVLAVAFKSCSSSLGWAVAFGIVLHEVPHRVGDFFIFLKAGMAIPQALVLNFLASMASLVGVVMLFASGAVSHHTLGVLLGVGTGALLFIGLTELLPPMLAVRERGRLSLHFVWFCVGCVVIGLSVLQDTHCHV